MRQQLVRGQIAGLTPVEDRLGDVRGEVAEADEPREVGWAHTLPLGQCGKRQAVATDECGVEAARPDQQFDQPRIGFRCRKWIGAIDPHRDLPPGTAQLYRYRQDLGFVVGRAWQWRSDIEECGEPGRAQMDIDLMGPDIDAVDQGGQEGTLLCSGQLGPALADFHGARDELALRAPSQERWERKSSRLPHPVVRHTVRRWSSRWRRKGARLPPYLCLYDLSMINCQEFGR